VKFAVLEVGLAGRLDATNIVDQDVSVHHKHRDRSPGISGEHEGKRSRRRKPGIIKGREPVVIGPTSDLPAIRDKAGARLIRAGDLDFAQYPGLQPRLLGRHQLENAAVAIRAAECLPWIRPIFPRRQYATWPGRLEESAVSFWTARTMWPQ